MADAQVLLKLVTKLPQGLRVPETPVAVPASIKRYGLSQIVNHLLQLESPQPFDFLINGELIRQTLEQHLLQHGLSAEAVLEVEYVPAVVPPRHKHTSPHDDWVSALAGSDAGVLSGSCDGSLGLWSGEGAARSMTAHAHSMGVTAVAWVPLAAGGQAALSGGKDRRITLWRVQQEGAAGASCTPAASYSGHTDSVAALSVSPDGSQFVSSGWDGAIYVWRAGAEVLEVAAAAEAAAGSAKGAAAKKRKVASAAANGAPVVTAAAASVAQEEAVGKLEGHLHCVSAVAWPAPQAVLSGGWDHSVRRWDVEHGVNTHTYNGSKAVYALAAASQQDASVVAFGGADPALRIWDMRSKSGEALNVKGYGSHSGWISAMAWCPGQQHRLATGSHDGTVKLWDIRASIPLATLKQHGDKVLAVAWAGAGRLVSGGADCCIRFYDAAAGGGPKDD